jgi:hypothetical protein
VFRLDRDGIRRLAEGGRLGQPDRA